MPAATRMAPSRQPVFSCTAVAQSRCSAVIQPSRTRISPSFSVTVLTCISEGSRVRITFRFGDRKVDPSG